MTGFDTDPGRLLLLCAGRWNALLRRLSDSSRHFSHPPLTFPHPAPLVEHVPRRSLARTLIKLHRHCSSLTRTRMHPHANAHSHSHAHAHAHPDLGPRGRILIRVGGRWQVVVVEVVVVGRHCRHVLDPHLPVAHIQRHQTLAASRKHRRRRGGGGKTGARRGLVLHGVGPLCLIFCVANVLLRPVIDTTPASRQVDAIQVLIIG